MLAAELPASIDRLYAHFLHTPASVTRYAAALRGLPWSVSAHAKDIWTTPDWEKREKLHAARWAVTCTRAGAAHLDALAPGKVRYAPHGIDLARFPHVPALPSRRDGADPGDPVIIGSVGRAVEKKGYDDVLEALARLPATLNWRFVHIGGGALRDALARQAERLGIAARVEWRGARTQDEVLALLREIDIFVLAARIVPARHVANLFAARPRAQRHVPVADHFALFLTRPGQGSRGAAVVPHEKRVQPAGSGDANGRAG